MNIYRVCGWICPERRESPVTRDVAAASRGTVPNRTVQYHTLLRSRNALHKHILPCLSQRKPRGKKAAVENRRNCGKLCGKIVENRIRGGRGRCGLVQACSRVRGASAGDRRTRCGLVRVCGWVRDGGCVVQGAGAAQGALAGFLAERKIS